MLGVPRLPVWEQLMLRLALGIMIAREYHSFVRELLQSYQNPRWRTGGAKEEADAPKRPIMKRGPTSMS